MNEFDAWKRNVNLAVLYLDVSLLLRVFYPYFIGLLLSPFEPSEELARSMV